MRYIAEACTDDYGDDSSSIPSVMACVDGLDEPRALRHARAMAAVLRAAKAWSKAATALESAYDRDERVSAGAPMVVAHLDMCSRLMRATARLVAVEKEVSR